MRIIILTIFFVVGGIVFLYLGTKSQNEIDKIGLEDLKLRLIGVVDTVDKGRNYHGYGIIRLKILSSNLKEYDPRSKQEFYFCIIKNNLAEVYDHTSATFEGDTLVYDTKSKLGAYLRNGKKEQEGTISINADKDYYKYIKQNTIFK
jgi:hypothetical protein